MEKIFNFIKNDFWLEFYKDVIVGCFEYVMDKKVELINGGKFMLLDFVFGYFYFGLYCIDKGWIFCEWVLNVLYIYMVGIFSNWEEKFVYKLKCLKNGSWEIKLLIDII